MRYILFIFLCFSLISQNLVAQDLKTYHSDVKDIHCADTKYYYEFSVVIKYKNTLKLKHLYTTYLNNEFKTTQGIQNGMLLHGVFKKYDLDKNLIEIGNYKSGLKNGTWLTYTNTGSIETIEKWKNGYLNGHKRRFCNNVLIDKVYFRHGVKKDDKHILENLNSLFKSKIE